MYIKSCNYAKYCCFGRDLLSLMIHNGVEMLSCSRIYLHQKLFHGGNIRAVELSECFL